MATSTPPTPQPSTPTMPQRYVEAFRLMKDGALILIIGEIVLVATVMWLLSGLFGSVLSAHGSIERIATWLIGVGIGALIGAIIGLVAILYGVYAKFIPGVTKLSEIDSSYSTAKTLIRLGYIWGVILMIIGIPLIPLGIGILILFVGLILFLLGHIGTIILCFNLNGKEGNSLYLIAGILFIIGIFVPILSFISWILLYIAFSNSESKWATAQSTQAPSPGPIALT